MHEPEVRKLFIETKGFCKVHTWQFEKISSPQGISEGYVTWVEKVAADLRNSVGIPLTRQKNNIEKLLPDSDHCQACRMLREREAVLLEQFINYNSKLEGQEYYQRSLGLCLPHLHKAFSLNSNEKIKDFLLIEQARHFEELSEDMHSYTLKRDAIRRASANDDENNAWMYVLIQLVGARTVQT